MQHYRCRCGKCTAFGSMPPYKCSGCDECNTTLEQHPDHHTVPEPHEYKTQYNQNTGEPYERCNWCMRTKNEIEKRKSK
jgi:hypothetical protein